MIREKWQYFSYFARHCIYSVSNNITYCDAVSIYIYLCVVTEGEFKFAQ